MTLKSNNASKINSNNIINNNDNTNDVANIQSTIKELNTKVFFEELREDCLMQGMKEDIKSILKCIGGMREELAKVNIESDKINHMERLATISEYEEFYNDVLEELEE